ncbi:class I SAM-dependent methyltransferase [Eisenibacter elegans]|uniref:class I SAM-dependent methyltransferase n=1 Tax=Eisenibacter elegans TaxID=997 RepID=UPI0005570B5D|nr:methyltransferase domain-containing protein [Eisenibacter elegans]
MNSYENKDLSYFSNARRDLISLVPQNPENKILELGAGSGSTLVELKKMGLAQEVVGIELLQMPNTDQSNPIIDALIFGNIEEFTPNLPLGYFDVILAGDVFEHLITPHQVVAKLEPFLKPGGLLISSIPNIREISALYRIAIKGEFTYEDSGIFDQTHMRFFCRKNIIELMTSVPSLKLVKIHSNLDLQPEARRRRLFNKLSGRVFEQFLSMQYLTIVQKHQ